jgi:6-phosphogluconate dehydrogenase
MVPAGKATDAVIRELSKVLSRGDAIIDGGNSNFQESIARAKVLGRRGLHFVDAGTSGGIHGLKEGYSLMIGGEKTVVDRLRPAFETLAPSPKRGWGHVGPAGSGHFVKMVHNGIEYGLMQAYAEGFEILKARKDFDLDLHQVAGIWRSGSIVRSKLLDLIAESLAEDQELSGIKGWVADSGEGRWAAFEAINEDVPAPVITLALMMRFVSRQNESYAAKLLAAMRNKFGGHEIKKMTSGQ